MSDIQPTEDNLKALTSFIDARVEFHVAEVVGQALAPFDAWAGKLEKMLETFANNDIVLGENDKGFSRALGELQKKVDETREMVQLTQQARMPSRKEL